MRSRDISWALALCVSLAIHTALVRWRAEAYVVANSHPKLPGFNRTFVSDRAPAQPDPPEDVGLLGDEKGTGYAVDASPGDEKLLARAGEQDQSYLSRDPQTIGQTSADRIPSQSPSGENGANGTRAAPDQQSQPSSNHPFGVQASAAQPTPAFKAPPDQQPGPAPAPQPATPAAVASVAQKQTVAMAANPQDTPAYQAPTGRPGKAPPAANPAPQADSESDPFAVVGSLEFRPGSTVVKIGRKHRITRPKLSWDTAYDFQSMTSAAVTMELQLDETGQVISAVVIKSSGSKSIDQPCRLAAYSWWFEPAKDATGKPVKDVITFTVKFF